MTPAELRVRTVNLKKLPATNLAKHPGRTFGLIVLVAVLTIAMFGGSMLVTSLRNGLASLEARLGADLIAVPQSANSTADLEKIVLEGVPGYFYMDKSYVDKIAAREGVEQVSPQYYLASVKAGCCSMPVQIIGIDPQTDFTIQPWIDHSYSRTLEREEVVAGSKITGAPGSTIMFYGIECTIVAKLDETGTALDEAVFATGETVQDLIAGSQEQGISVLADNDPAQVVSTVQVKVASGYNPTDVVNDIKLHVRGATAVQTKSMLSGVADSIGGAAGVIGVLMAVLWVLAVIVLVVAFAIQARYRVKEFAILRVLGASRRDLTGIVVRESLLVSVLGAVCGVVIVNVLTYAFGTALESALGLPFLVPELPVVAGLAAAALAVSVLAGCAASAVAALKLSRVDAGQILREE